MPLPDPVAVKFDLYTLACSELLARYGDLQRATASCLTLPYTKCEEIFNKRLQEFFNIDPVDTKEAAAQRLGDSLKNLADAFRGHERRAGAIFDQVVAELTRRAPHWHHLDELERLHVQGRDLARRFYAASPQEETRQRLDLTCNLDVEFRSDDKAAPACYLEKDRTILLRFNYKQSFKNYLAYPFIFLHEYTAHVHALDNRTNEVFHDGWMIFAAENFLWEERNRARMAGREFELIAEQIKLPASLRSDPQDPQFNHIPDRGYIMASEFHKAFPDHLMPITFELAAFQPLAGEKPFWPSKFLNSLSAELDSNQVALSTKLQNTRDVRELRDSLITV